MPKLFAHWSWRRDDDEHDTFQLNYVDISISRTEFDWSDQQIRGQDFEFARLLLSTLELIKWMRPNSEQPELSYILDHCFSLVQAGSNRQFFQLVTVVFIRGDQTHKFIPYFILRATMLVD